MKIEESCLLLTKKETEKLYKELKNLSDNIEFEEHCRMIANILLTLREYFN